MTDLRIEAAARAICADFMKDGKTLGAARLCTQDAFIDLASSAIAAADEASWRPIDTAPLDGTEVLVFCPFIGYTLVARAEKAGNWYEVSQGRNEDPELFDYPEFWMPLPKPPKEGA